MWQFFWLLHWVLQHFSKHCLVFKVRNFLHEMAGSPCKLQLNKTKQNKKKGQNFTSWIWFGFFVSNLNIRISVFLQVLLKEYKQNYHCFVETLNTSMAHTILRSGFQCNLNFLQHRDIKKGSLVQHGLVTSGLSCLINFQGVMLCLDTAAGWTGRLQVYTFRNNVNIWCKLY